MPDKIVPIQYTEDRQKVYARCQVYITEQLTEQLKNNRRDISKILEEVKDQFNLDFSYSGTIPETGPINLTINDFTDGVPQEGTKTYPAFCILNNKVCIVKQLLGESNADVFMLQDPDGNEIVLKRFKPDEALQENAQFEIETLAAMTEQPDSAIKLIGHYISGNQQFVFMNYIPAQDLRKFLDAHDIHKPRTKQDQKDQITELKYEEKLDIAINIFAQALLIQKAGYVHQDLKGENFLIYDTADGKKLQIFDFDSSRPIGTQQKYSAGGPYVPVINPNTALTATDAYSCARTCSEMFDNFNIIVQTKNSRSGGPIKENLYTNRDILFFYDKENKSWYARYQWKYYDDNDQQQISLVDIKITNSELTRKLNSTLVTNFASTNRFDEQLASLTRDDMVNLMSALQQEPEFLELQKSKPFKFTKFGMEQNNVFLSNLFQQMSDPNLYINTDLETMHLLLQLHKEGRIQKNEVLTLDKLVQLAEDTSDKRTAILRKNPNINNLIVLKQRYPNIFDTIKHDDAIHALINDKYSSSKNIYTLFGKNVTYSIIEDHKRNKSIELTTIIQDMTLLALITANNELSKTEALTHVKQLAIVAQDKIKSNNGFLTSLVKTIYTNILNSDKNIDFRLIHALLQMYQKKAIINNEVLTWDKLLSLANKDSTLQNNETLNNITILKKVNENIYNEIISQTEDCTASLINNIFSTRNIYTTYGKDVAYAIIKAHIGNNNIPSLSVNQDIELLIDIKEEDDSLGATGLTLMRDLLKDAITREDLVALQELQKNTKITNYITSLEKRQEKGNIAKHTELKQDIVTTWNAISMAVTKAKHNADEKNKNSEKQSEQEALDKKIIIALFQKINQTNNVFTDQDSYSHMLEKGKKHFNKQSYEDIQKIIDDILKSSYEDIAKYFNNDTINAIVGETDSASDTNKKTNLLKKALLKKLMVCVEQNHHAAIETKIIINKIATFCDESSKLVYDNVSALQSLRTELLKFKLEKKGDKISHELFVNQQTEQAKIFWKKQIIAAFISKEPHIAIADSFIASLEFPDNIDRKQIRAIAIEGFERKIDRLINGNPDVEKIYVPYIDDYNDIKKLFNEAKEKKDKPNMVNICIAGIFAKYGSKLSCLYLYKLYKENENDDFLKMLLKSDILQQFLAQDEIAVLKSLMPNIYSSMPDIDSAKQATIAAKSKPDDSDDMKSPGSEPMSLEPMSIAILRQSAILNKNINIADLAKIDGLYNPTKSDIILYEIYKFQQKLGYFVMKDTMFIEGDSTKGLRADFDVENKIKHYILIGNQLLQSKDILSACTIHNAITKMYGAEKIKKLAGDNDVFNNFFTDIENTRSLITNDGKYKIKAIPDIKSQGWPELCNIYLGIGNQGELTYTIRGPQLQEINGNLRNMQAPITKEGKLDLDKIDIDAILQELSRRKQLFGNMFSIPFALAGEAFVRKRELPSLTFGDFLLSMQESLSRFVKYTLDNLPSADEKDEKLIAAINNSYTSSGLSEEVKASIVYNSLAVIEKKAEKIDTDNVILIKQRLLMLKDYNQKLQTKAAVVIEDLFTPQTIDTIKSTPELALLAYPDLTYNESNFPFTRKDLRAFLTQSDDRESREKILSLLRILNTPETSAKFRARVFSELYDASLYNLCLQMKFEPNASFPEHLAAAKLLYDHFYNMTNQVEWVIKKVTTASDKRFAGISDAELIACMEILALAKEHNHTKGITKKGNQAMLDCLTEIKKRYAQDVNNGVKLLSHSEPVKDFLVKLYVKKRWSLPELVSRDLGNEARGLANFFKSVLGTVKEAFMDEETNTIKKSIITTYNEMKKSQSVQASDTLLDNFPMPTAPSTDSTNTIASQSTGNISLSNTTSSVTESNQEQAQDTRKRSNSEPTTDNNITDATGRNRSNSGPTI